MDFLKLARVRYPQYATSSFYDVSYWRVLDRGYIKLNNNNKFSLKPDYSRIKNNYTRVTVKKTIELYPNNTKIAPEKPKNND